jgi:hypothetical protein
MPAPQVQPLNVPIVSELTTAHEGSPWVEIGLLIADCWQQLFLLHKSLAELKRTNAYSWELLEQGDRLRRIPSVINSQRIDPEVWRKRAEEARTLANMITNTEAKRSLAQIADSYEALASFQEDPK